MAGWSLESMPVGFRFKPTDEELINHFLKGKIRGRKDNDMVIPEIDVCKFEPWDLPGSSPYDHRYRISCILTNFFRFSNLCV